MAFKLTREERDQLANVRQKAKNAFDDLVGEAQDLEEARSKYLDAREQVTNVVTDIAARFRAEFEDKSDTWKEGDKGGETEDFVSCWESIENDLNEIDEVPAFDDTDFEEALDNLPEEPQ